MICDEGLLWRNKLNWIKHIDKKLYWDENIYQRNYEDLENELKYRQLKWRNQNEQLYIKYLKIIFKH